MTFSFASIAFISIYRAKSSLEKEMTKALAESVHATADAIKDFNEMEFKKLETFACLPNIRDPEVDLIEKTHIIYNATSFDKDYIDVCILDTNGSAWINNGVKMVSFSERNYFKSPYATGKQFMTDPFINKVTNEPCVFYSVPVFDSNKNIINIIFCVVDAYKICNMTTSHKAGNNRSSFLISMRDGQGGANEAYSEIHSQGIVIAAENLLAQDAKLEAFGTENIFEKAKIPGNENYAEALELLKKQDKGCVTYKKAGKKYVMSFEKVPETEWIAMNEIPYADFQTDINAMQNAIIIYVAVLMIISVLVVGFFISKAIKPLDTLKTAINGIASGNADLSKRISIKSDDEIGEVVNGFNRFAEKLHVTISDIKTSKETLSKVGTSMSENAKETANSISTVYSSVDEMKNHISSQRNSVMNTTDAVKKVSYKIDSLERLIETQASGVEQASSAVEQMIGNIAAVNNSVEQMTKSFDNLLSKTQGGVSKQSLVSNKIKAIETQSATLQGANKIISKIASQTNMLAMNAAIEAAHAGDSGKGFSVVADEIKKLSESSQLESNKISEQLSEIVKSVSDVVTASNEASVALNQVSELIDITNGIVHQIHNAMEEQTTGSKQIGDALHVMNDATGDVRDASREMAVENKSILDEIKKLQNITESMKSNMEKIIFGADEINESGSELNLIAPQVQSAIDHISVQIDQFKV